jgi:hypothetical protein
MNSIFFFRVCSYRIVDRLVLCLFLSPLLVFPLLTYIYTQQFTDALNAATQEANAESRSL